MLTEEMAYAVKLRGYLVKLGDHRARRSSARDLDFEALQNPW